VSQICRVVQGSSYVAVYGRQLEHAMSGRVVVRMER
jgi:hypothetical protein